MSSSHTKRLIVAVKRWAAFQECDSLRDQATDIHLRNEAQLAREQLIEAIDALPDAPKERPNA